MYRSVPRLVLDIHGPGARPFDVGSTMPWHPLGRTRFEIAQGSTGTGFVTLMRAVALAAVGEIRHRRVRPIARR